MEKCTFIFGIVAMAHVGRLRPLRHPMATQPQPGQGPTRRSFRFGSIDLPTVSDRLRDSATNRSYERQNRNFAASPAIRVRRTVFGQGEISLTDCETQFWHFQTAILLSVIEKFPASGHVLDGGQVQLTLVSVLMMESGWR